MLTKFTGKPLWYKLWSLSVAICAIYFLIKYFFFEPTKTDQFIQVYALFSILLDYFLFPKQPNAKGQ